MEQKSLTRSYALLALNGLSTSKMTAEKKERLHAMLCATFFDLLLSGHTKKGSGYYEIIPYISEAPTVVCFFAHYHNKRLTLRQWLRLLSGPKQKILEDYESAVTIELISDHLLDEVADLSECDLLHNPQAPRESRYRSENAAYHYEYEQLRMLLNDEADVEPSRELVTLLWLLEQSCLLDTIFSQSEIVDLHIKRPALFRGDEYAKILYRMSLDHSARAQSQRMELLLKGLKNSRLEPLVSEFVPKLQARETVFLASRKYCRTPKLRLEFAIYHLNKRGHVCSVLKDGERPILEIDNIPYELLGRSISIGDTDISGVQLVPYKKGTG